jgi:hemerythrin-like metal-binding protein
MGQYTWDDRLLTGYAEVDAQHRRLFALLEGLAEHAATATTGADELRQAVDALSRYAQEHFDDELEMMQKERCDLRHVMMHVQEHGAFVRRVSMFGESLSTDQTATRRQASELVAFLAEWLRHHIRVVDQVMARQLRRIAAGSSPAEAYAAELAQHPDARAAQLFAPPPG